MKDASVRARLTSRPQEVGRARRVLADRLAEWGVGGENADIAILLTSELVTNAIQHGRAPVVLEASVASGRLRVQVVDTSGNSVQPQPASLDDVRGRGLYLVDALADLWGSDHGTAGKRVWFELETRQFAQ